MIASLVRFQLLLWALLHGGVELQYKTSTSLLLVLASLYLAGTTSFVSFSVTIWRTQGGAIEEL
ncbi:hypothetical protein M758_5G007100 [Ceratodon purpureus]|uniref:Uncharacterized protein n=1 Tax=Ceratodon purpureus TaxID=3225 RepID=A0A8T0HWH8_CERPU|nr:hypothetical protein KC19_5G006200 [Ceratodon purpureus]KAG0614998.1 hypothetical protein M758_5G007100 [Ceratodon purpureus]